MQNKNNKKKKKTSTKKGFDTVIEFDFCMI